MIKNKRREEENVGFIDQRKKKPWEKGERGHGRNGFILFSDGFEDLSVVGFSDKDKQFSEETTRVPFFSYFF